MNKQQLANKIWASANKMRSKIDANEYKDYILGFIFYKFLSDKEKQYLKDKYWTEEDMKTDLNEENVEDCASIKENIGYFIPYKYLFSTWTENPRDFNVGDVRDALNSFERNIKKTHHRVFDNIFDTLETGLSKLGGTDGEQTKALRRLFKLIKPIPTDDSQGYDVLGFIYEYLIGNFAASAGKKAGEFYTPHEVALLMADIVADHLQDREKIDIYDPTSGSGSLLINIGRAVAKHKTDKNNIKYYAQELKENTYNLTRMNLVMRGIIPDNIIVRNGDTLEQDWPYFDETDDGKPIEGTYDYLQVDAVVSNPPYSQNWDPDNKKSDKRFKEYGLAPKGKADYAFLLHNLYHIKDDGIVTIVLPHGVLFRGGDDETIRTSLVEHNNIDTIIGLPANIFFGTQIATIIMVLRKNRQDDEGVLIVDASKGFAKEGKRNKLRASDIRCIADTVIHRREIPKYSRLISRDLIRQNNYNLNIPRYVDSSDAPETWDVYASMFGGVPQKEIDALDEYWEAFPFLREQLFEEIEGTQCTRLKTNDIVETVKFDSDEVFEWEKNISEAFDDFPDYLDREIISGMEKINIPQEEDLLTKEIFRRIGKTPLIDRYAAYQILSDHWNGKNDDDQDSISNDLEIIQTEGLKALRQVDPNMVPVKSKNDEDEDTEVQKGWCGHILPFELVQQNILTKDYDHLQQTRNDLIECQQEITAMMDELSEEDRENFLNETNDAFDMDKVLKALIKALEDVSTPELQGLSQYLDLLAAKAKKTAKVEFINAHNEIDWTAIEPSKDGTYSKGNVQKRIAKLRSDYQFPEDSTEAMLQKVNRLDVKEKAIKHDISEQELALHNKTKEIIPKLSDEQVHQLLVEKWIEPLYNELNALPSNIIDTLISRLQALVAKYSNSLVDIEKQISDSGNELASLLPQLKGNDADNKALGELMKLVKTGNVAAGYAVAEKMFPKDGELVPEIRFCKFEGNWVSRPAKKLFSLYSDKGYPDLPVLSASQEEGMILRDNVGINMTYDKKNVSSYKRVRPGQFVIHLRSFQGGFAHSDVEGITSPAYTVFGLKDTDNQDDNFWKIYFTSKAFIKRLETVTYGIRDGRSISVEGVMDLNLSYPTTKAEQTVIAKFFSSLDNNIKANTAKLEKLKQIRKGLLEKMFVSND